MEHLVGKLCKLTISVNNTTLFYLATINSTDKTHIYFTDKHNNKYGFRKTDLIEIKEVKP